MSVYNDAVALAAKELNEALDSRWWQRSRWWRRYRFRIKVARDYLLHTLATTEQDTEQ